MTTCPTDALKDNQSNPYPGGRKPKPKLPSSVSKLISLFWKKTDQTQEKVKVYMRERRHDATVSYSSEMRLLFTFLSLGILWKISPLNETFFSLLLALRLLCGYLYVTL